MWSLLIRQRSLVVLALAGTLALAFILGYLLGQGPKWALWELGARGTVVRATTEFFSTRWGCATTRDQWNKREESRRTEEEEKWRRENPEPRRGGILQGPLIIHVEYECYPIGVTPGVQRTPLFR